MEKKEKIEAYFNADGPFRDGLRTLRQIVAGTTLAEDLKWGAPVYTHGKHNVLGLRAFKNHFGIWFFNGVFLSDPQQILENAQEGKTKAMRHWKFTDASQIREDQVRAYVEEAISNADRGLKLEPAKPKKMILPGELQHAFKEEPELKIRFEALAPYQQRDYAEHIASARQTDTRVRRLNKILPMIRKGIGLNQKYRRK